VFANLGIAIEASSPMITTTISSSISVNPLRGIGPPNGLAQYYPSIREHRQGQMRRQAGRAPDAVRLGPKVRRPGLEDIGDVRLGIAIDDREPGALHLGHDAVTLQEAVVL